MRAYVSDSTDDLMLMTSQPNLWTRHTQVQQAAAARLAPEPDGGIRVPVRLPDGSRFMRRFEKEETVSALYDWCVSLSAALAATDGR